jgi:hypothetical protein
MTKGKNAFGLSRKIDDKIKYKVRRRCCFGCVICGSSIIQYHHFEPQFSEAKFHSEKGITILCGTCHDKTHKGIISQKKILEANSNPYCKKNQNAKDIFYLGNTTIPVKFGSSTIHAKTILMYDNSIIIGFKNSESSGSPIRFNAVFTDKNGDEILRIQDNEWIVGEDCFDITIKKSTLIITDELKNIAIEMNLAVDNMIHINQLNMFYKGFVIKADNNSFTLTVPSGGSFGHVGANYADIGIWMKSTGYALVASNKDGVAAVGVGPQI